MDPLRPCLPSSRHQVKNWATILFRIQLLPQPLRDLCSLILRPRVQQRLDGEVPFRRRVLYPCVEFVPGHVSFHDPGVIFFVRPLVELPHVVASDLLLKADAGSNLAAGLLCLTGRDIFTAVGILKMCILS